MNNLAPIVLFVYNRFDETLQTLKALSQNELAPESTLYVYADGPKDGANAQEIEAIKKVRHLIREQSTFKEVIIYENKENKGLANSIIEGVTEVVNKFGRVIVLEDDIITSKFFLTFLNEGLEIYENSNNVYAINAYMFPLKDSPEKTFLSPLGTSSWGWATWANRWQAFERVPRYKLIIQNELLLRTRFNFADYDYASMLDNESSWAIRWYYSVFIRNGLGLFPSRSLCMNIGFGVNATHTKSSIKQDVIFEKKMIVSKEDQIDFELHCKLLKYFQKPQKRSGLKGKFASVVKRLKMMLRYRSNS